LRCSRLSVPGPAGLGRGAVERVRGGKAVRGAGGRRGAGFAVHGDNDAVVAGCARGGEDPLAIEGRRCGGGCCRDGADPGTARWTATGLMTGEAGARERPRRCGRRSTEYDYARPEHILWAGCRCFSVGFDLEAVEHDLHGEDIGTEGSPRPGAAWSTRRYWPGKSTVAGRLPCLETSRYGQAAGESESGRAAATRHRDYTTTGPRADAAVRAPAGRVASAWA